MGLIDQIRADIINISTSQSDFGVPIAMTAPTLQSISLYGLHSKHHLGINGDGNRVNAKNAHISIPEKALSDANYPVRNVRGEVDLKGHKVSAPDNTGIVKLYKISEWYPSETTGLIVCILVDFE
jgi:hypothetical protein